MAFIPAVVETNLDAISCFPDGKIALASSNLTGRYWNGSLWYFKNVDDAPEVEKCLTGIEISSGICDLVLLDKDKIAVGLDSGALEIYHLDADSQTPIFTNIFSNCEHDDHISSISLNSDETKLVSAGADKCVKVWDLNTYATTQTYRPVHSGIVWQIACSKEDPHLFVSCGQDGKILLFDPRLEKPATALETTEMLKNEITAVAWDPRNPDLITVGDGSGVMSILDIKKNKVLCSWNVHSRRIFRIAYSQKEPWVASCADDSDVCVSDVIDPTHPKSIFTNNSHDDFVRGIAWNPENELITCAWDKKVLKHTISEVHLVD